MTLALCGDVMLGRGVDQVLPHPSDPTLWEGYVRDARDYVRLAEALNGPIPRPVDMTWPWGDALDLLERAAPDVRLINLETSVTRCADAAPDKGIHYRMHPANLPCLSTARPDACVLANNHVLDLGHRGLADTLDALRSAGLRTVGAGHDAEQAWQPAVLPVGTARTLVLAFGMPSSGIPPGWAATEDRPGVAFVPRLSVEQAGEVVDRVRRSRRPGDLVICSVHWGSNWGYRVDHDQVRFAHALIDGGVDVVHGHSSHHPRPIEVYRDRLILYGCGDLINDYEGIPGHEQYRDELRLLYLAEVRSGTGELITLRMAPLRARQMRLEPASAEETGWLSEVLDEVSRDHGARVDVSDDGMLVLRRS